MGGGFAPRFAVEVGFLGLLALAVGLAELDTPWIVAVMAVGWLLVALVEWLAWRTELEEEAAGGPVAPLEAEREQPTDSWDIEEILAPLPADEIEDGDRPRPERGRHGGEA